MPAKGDDSNSMSLEQFMAGLLALAVAEREDRLGGETGKARRSEAVLADAGLPLTAIARITGKNYEAVKSIVRRSHASAGLKQVARSEGELNGA